MRPPQDARWLSQTVADHELKLLRYATSLVGPSLAADLVQEAFLRLCKQDRAEVEAYVAAWLFKVLRNLCWNAMRGERRMNLETMLDGIASIGADPERHAAGRQRLSLAAKAMGDLPQRQAEALHLKLGAGLSYKQIAAVMDTSVSNVGVLVHTGLRSVRSALAEVEQPSDSERVSTA